jgi:benzoylformate decarboxylase
VVGDEIVKSDALDEAALLASRLGCPAYQQAIPYGAHFISDHPCFMGALPRDQQQTSKILEAYDLLIVLG